jgi:hypothetical protein
VNNRSSAALNAFLIAVMFAIALWAIHELPAGARIAMHWGSNGHPDGWTGKWTGLLFNPVIASVIWYALSVFPQGFSLPGKLPLPAHAQRALFSCVLLCQIAAEMFIAISALSGSGAALE